MGLDQFLTKRKYYSEYMDDGKPEYILEVEKQEKQILQEIIFKGITWRKSNQIHRWFVENIQDGNDDCGEYHVYKDQLEALLTLINKVLEASELVEGKIQNGSTYEDGKWVPIMEEGKYIKDKSVAKKFLPTASGCFFGGVGYDEYYIYDLTRTKEELEKLLANDKDYDYYYSSSW